MEMDNVLFEDFFEKVKNSGKHLDLKKIKKAYDIASVAHSGQMRLSGEPYFTHPVSVAEILLELGMDSDSIIAGLLHDVVEDTSVSKEEVEKEFGPDVALLVDGVTKLGRVPLSSKEQQQAENIRKMLLAMSKDIRVIIIKLADRLHNMRTAQGWNEQKRRDKSLETMEIYAPLAHRLGIRAVKEELEDISLRYLDDIAYEEITKTLKEREFNNADYIEYIKKKIAKRLQETKIKYKIDGRVKSHYGIYRKVYMAGRGWGEIFDIYAIRVIVDTVEECYNVLGAMHDLFTPIPNRFKDYISMPKPNMYQSLHTTVIDKEGIPFEIQIRTWDMHYTAEYGIAAHWKYKEGIKGKDSLEERLAWIRRIIETQRELEDDEDLMHSIKTDLGSEEVFVFTPNGDVKSLPVESTIIDFAYSIHSEVGNRMIGAKVDGKIVPIETKIQTGQVIEIIRTKSQSHGPSRNWLKIVRTSEARNKIRTWFKKEKREENIEEGKAEIDREFKRNKINLPNKQMEDFLLQVAKKHHFNAIDDFYASIGYGGTNLQNIMPRIEEAYLKLIKTDKDIVKLIKPISKKSDNGVVVEGIDDCLVKFSKCCNPLPGDDIVGYTTRGHGVSVHKRSCPNIVSVMKDETQSDRFLNVSWESQNDVSYRTTIEIITDNRTGMLADISVALAAFRISISELNARTLKNGNASILATIDVLGVEQFLSIKKKILKIDGVISVDRAVL